MLIQKYYSVTQLRHREIRFNKSKNEFSIELKAFAVAVDSRVPCILKFKSSLSCFFNSLFLLQTLFGGHCSRCDGIFEETNKLPNIH